LKKKSQKYAAINIFGVMPHNFTYLWVEADKHDLPKDLLFHSFCKQYLFHTFYRFSQLWLNLRTLHRSVIKRLFSYHCIDIKTVNILKMSTNQRFLLIDKKRSLLIKMAQKVCVFVDNRKTWLSNFVKSVGCSVVKAPWIVLEKYALNHN